MGPTPKTHGRRTKRKKIKPCLFFDPSCSADDRRHGTYDGSPVLARHGMGRDLCDHAARIDHDDLILSALLLYPWLESAL